MSNSGNGIFSDYNEYRAELMDRFEKITLKDIVEALDITDRRLGMAVVLGVKAIEDKSSRLSKTDLKVNIGSALMNGLVGAVQLFGDPRYKEFFHYLELRVVNWVLARMVKDANQDIGIPQDILDIFDSPIKGDAESDAKWDAIVSNIKTTKDYHAKIFKDKLIDKQLRVFAKFQDEWDLVEQNNHIFIRKEHFDECKSLSGLQNDQYELREMHDRDV